MNIVEVEEIGYRNNNKKKQKQKHTFPFADLDRYSVWIYLIHH